MQRVLLPKNRVKLLLNMLVIAVGTIPRGGTLMVDAIGEGEATGFRITTSGLNARISQALPDLLAGSPENGTIDAHAVQPFYTGLLAKACNVAVTPDAGRRRRGCGDQRGRARRFVGWVTARHGPLPTSRCKPRKR